MIQVLIKRRGGSFSKGLDRVPWFRTLIFMVFSAITLDSLRNIKPDISWCRKIKHNQQCFFFSKIFIFNG